MTDRTCEYAPCSNPLEGKRPEARFCSDECRYEDWNARYPRQGRESRTTDELHPLAEITEAQEAAKAEWSTAIYAEVVRILTTRGSFHADDLEPMGIPEDCGNVKSAQIGSVVHKGYMQEVGRRASSVPANHRRKSGVYELTRKGRETLSKRVGLGAGPKRRTHGEGQRPSEPSPAGPSVESSEPASLFSTDTGQAAPLNPLSSAEAA